MGIRERWKEIRERGRARIKESHIKTQEAKPKIKKFVKEQLGLASMPAMKKVTPLVMPMGGFSGGGLIGSTKSGVIKTTGKSIATGAKNLFQKATGNPLGSLGFKSGLKQWGTKIGGRAIGYGAAVETFRYMRAKSAGEPFNPIPDIGTIASFAVNPVTSFFGLGVGSGEKGTKKLIDVLTNKNQKDFYIPSPIPNFDFGGYDGGDTIINFPSGGGGMGGGFTPSPIVSVNPPSFYAGMDSGMPDLATLALLLGIPLSALLIYLGLKPEKEKKKKKRKKYKGGKRK